MARRKEAHGGGHGWFVTFADLMGLLVSFFVMLVAFSNQDAKKVQVATGSMQEAFGVQKTPNFSGVSESDSVAPRDKVKNAAHVNPKDSSITPTPNEKGADLKHRQAFDLASVSLRQTLEGMPELTEASKHISIEQSSEGLNIEIVDQDGSSMFPEGSKEPYERARQLIQKIAGPLKATPYRIAITGHTAASRATPRSDYGPWNLSVDRANAVRQILEEEGYPSENIYKVAGKADTDPLLPEDPTSAPNRRVTITLVREASPMPPDLHP
jgi:chemotaxis protein MotB